MQQTCRPLEFKNITNLKAFTSHLNDDRPSWDTQRGMEHGWEMEEEEKKDSKRWLFAQILLAGLPKIMTHTLLIHLKEKK